MTDGEVVAYLNRLTYEMGTDKTELALLNCSRGGTACPPAEWAPVFIQPEMGMDLRGPTDIPAEGVVVARIINFDMDGRSEARFGFPPSQRAWWYVDLDQMNKPRSRFFIRTHSTTGPAVQFIGPTLSFSPCRDDPLSVSPAMAKWRKCGSRLSHNSLHEPGLAPAARPRFLPISFAPGARDLPSAAAVASDVWVKCMANCCISG